MSENLKPDDIVTFEITKGASNTFILDGVLDGVAYLRHPLNKECVVKALRCDLNQIASVLKDDTERCLDFAKNNKEYLDFNTVGDLDALCLYFVYKRQLTPKQKSTVSNICGIIASIKFNNDIQKTMNFIVRNEGLLDEFNRMWYNNFKGLFSGEQFITSKKQRASIFNIAGFILAQLENPIISK